MVKPEEIHDLEQARRVIGDVQKIVTRMEEMQHRIDRLEAENRLLKGRVEELMRGGKRRAAPFSRGESKEEPKKPERQAGLEARHRAEPDKIDRAWKAVLPKKCECGGGGIIRDDQKKRIQIDMPRSIPVTVTQFDVEIGYCAVHDRADLEKIEKSKCLGHVIRRCSELRKDKRGRAVMLSRSVQMLLRYAIQLKDRRQRMSNEFHSQARAWVEKQMDVLPVTRRGVA